MDQHWLERIHIIRIPLLGLWEWWYFDEAIKCDGQTTRPLCSVTGHKLGPLIANRCGVILMGTGLSVEDLGFESPLCVGTNSQSTQLAKTWGLHLDPVVGVCKGTFLGKLVASLYAVLSWACVHYRWQCVSLEEKAYPGRHLVLSP